MSKINEDVRLESFVPEFAEALVQQLVSDYARWGDTWRHRPREGQEGRGFATFDNYYDRFQHAGVPIPWLKVAGEALIAYVREVHPEFLITEEDVDGR